MSSSDISRRFTSSSKSRNTHEISDIFHFAAIQFLPERHSAMVLIYMYIRIGHQHQSHNPACMYRVNIQCNQKSLQDMVIINLLRVT